MEYFRVHHILCTSLYEGKGYSGAFCENMSSVVERLRANPEEELVPVAEPDVICAGCPNRTEQGECAQNQNSVVEKDRFLAEQLGISTGRVSTYRELCRQAAGKMTREIFARSCETCDWHRQGLCRYEALTAQLKRITAFCD